MGSRLGDTVINWMNRDRIKGEVLDQITIDGRCVQLGGCLDGAAPPLLSGEKGGLYAEISACQAIYKIGKSQIGKSYL